MQTILSPKYIEDVEKIQTACANAYLDGIELFKDKMSEKDIQLLFIHNLGRVGLNRYWYDIGIMVLIGVKRFQDMKQKEYERKRPLENVYLKNGEPIFIDMHPMDDTGAWGDFSSMLIFKPKPEDWEKVTFLEQMYRFHMDGIHNLKPSMTGTDIYNWYVKNYNEKNITLQDVRNTVGHTMSSGEKKSSEGQDKRIFLDSQNNISIGGSILAIEPGGYTAGNGKILVGKFEDCVYVPNTGKPIILGRKRSLPFFIN